VGALLMRYPASAAASNSGTIAVRRFMAFVLAVTSA